ncbi:DUF6084 family protein [Streptomyces chitinivorans]|uniref:DUF6084 family protein n=1 Tax=Streptomyces chitinivorans TaxID=1257027 RepID=A0ABW7HVI8_9ACTN|nr:DUF6084 family protein [Streptomyces chitinivorans]MDH2409378.1 DUF6084 family protein [Streptomyces chitinivorans]
MTAPRAKPAGAPSRHLIPALSFEIAGAEPERHAAVPTLRFDVEITRTGGGPVRSVSLTTAIRIDVTRRHYDQRARAALAELFGEPERWATTLRPLAWTRTTTVVPPFDETTTVGLTVPCPCDAELAVTKYLRSVPDGEVPLDFLFSGTVFFDGGQGRLRTAQISWAEDAGYRLPAALWHTLVDRYSGGSPWLRLSRETHDRLDAYRARWTLGTLDDAVGALLDRAEGLRDRSPATPDIPRTPETTGAPWTT